MNWKTSRGLHIRMVAVMILLGLLFSGFIVSTFFIVESIAVMALVGIVIATLAWSGPKVALKTAGASEVTPEQRPEIHNRVSRIAHQADVPKPSIAVSKTDAPNAFMTGRSKDTATLCLTEGLIESLDGEELDAVIAHEVSHMKNRDMAIMMVASTFATAAHFVVRWGWLADDGGQAGQGAGAIVAAILVSLVTWIGTYVLMRVLSKYREFTADRGAAAITGKPSALASALRKIDDTVSEVPKEDLRDFSDTNAVNFYEFEVDHMSKLMRTHPETEDRIEKLGDMESEMRNRSF